MDERDILCSRKGIHKLLQDQLTRNKFLVIINGELRNSDWNTILSALPNESNGCRVIRTVQGTHKAISAAGDEIIPVKPFETDEAIELFYQMVQMDKYFEDEELTTRLSNNNTNIDNIAEGEKQRTE